MKVNIKKYANQFRMMIILALLLAIFSVTGEGFFTFSNGMNILKQVSTIAIMGVGMTMVVISGGIDLSVGALLSLVTVFTATVMTKCGLNPIVASLLGLAMATLLGLLNGLVITITKMPPMVCGFGMMAVIKGIAYLITNGMPVYGIPEEYKVIGQGALWKIPIPAVIMLVIIFIGATILNKTYFGRYIYAVGSNEEAARLSGINVASIRRKAYMISGFLSGVAGLIMLSRINSGQAIAGEGNEMDVLTAAVLGGVSFNGGHGKVGGMLVGDLVMAVLKTGLMIVGISEYWQQVIRGAVLLIAVGFDSLQSSRKVKAES